MNSGDSRELKKVRLPNKEFTVGELATTLNVLAKEHKISLQALIRKLDRVSGNLAHLEMTLAGDNRFDWSTEEDELLQRN